MTLFERVFGGNDAVYGPPKLPLTMPRPVRRGPGRVLPDTALLLPCYYAVTGTKVSTLRAEGRSGCCGKSLMTRNRLNDVLSGVATALCAEFIEVLKRTSTWATPV